MQKLLLLVIVMPSFLSAQKLNVELFGGFSNYQGDLQEKRFTANQSRGAFGIGARYNLTDHWAVRSHFTYGKIAASDRFNADSLLRGRNLSFESKMTELNLLLDYSLFSLNEKNFTPYVFGGIAVYHFNPFAFDSSGVKQFLKPLSTEGQGLAQYPDRTPYNLTQISIPMGIGLRWRVSDNIVLGYEIGLRKTFTDYLDDVSTTYVDENILLAERGAKAVEMSFRGSEKTNAVYPGEFGTRGGAKYKDWYYFSGITLSIGLHTSGRERGMRDRGSMGCPKL